MRVRTLLIGLLVVAAPLLAGCEPSPTAIQASFQPNSIDVGRSTEIRGTVTPATAGTTVVLEQKVGAEWRRHRSMETRAGGALYFHLDTPAVGTYAFRVRSGSTSSPTFYLKVHDRVPLGLRWGPTRLSTVHGPQTLATTTYADPISYAGCAGISSALFQFQPKGEFSRVEMVIGMAMASPAGSQRQFTIRGDGKVLRTGTANVGSHHRTVLDLAGVRQLDIEILSTPFGCGTTQSKGTFVLGDPYLYR